MRDVHDTQAPSAVPDQADAAAEFRRLMGLFATGVCVVSVNSGKDAIAAMTVNSFVSVSLDPMVVCWSLQNSSSQFDVYARADRFAVSILAQDQAELATRYAARGDTQLRELDFTQSAQGLPVIAGALGHFGCQKHSDHLVGDHTMIFGEVAGLRIHRALDDSISPLGFFNGKFCSIEQ
ncbi:MAG: flavin reductase family protein [Erythrobacter sp.]